MTRIIKSLSLILVLFLPGCLFVPGTYYLPTSTSGTIEKAACRGRVGPYNIIVFDINSTPVRFRLTESGGIYTVSMWFDTVIGDNVRWLDSTWDVVINDSIDAVASMDRLIEYDWQQQKEVERDINEMLTVPPLRFNGTDARAIKSDARANNKNRAADSYVADSYEADSYYGKMRLGGLEDYKVETFTIQSFRIMINDRVLEIPSVTFKKKLGLFQYVFNC